MNAFFETVSLAFVWVLAQNIVLTGGYGITPVLRSPKSGQNLLIFAGLVTVFSFLSSMICMPLNLLFDLFAAGKYFIPLAFILILGLLYFSSCVLMKRFFPLVFRKIRPVLAPSAFNTLVLAVLLLNDQADRSFFACAGFAITSGLAFLIATFIAYQGEKAATDPEVPAIFSGFPARFIYLGLAAMAFCAFSAHSFS